MTTEPTMTTELNQGRFRDQVLRAAADRAAQPQAEFTAYMERDHTDASLFVKLISICDGKMAESIVLWDMLKYVEKRGLQAHKDAAASDYIKSYGSRHSSARAYRRAVTDLIAEDFLIEVPRAPTIPKRFFLNWLTLAGALENDVDMKLPGLRSTDAR